MKEKIAEIIWSKFCFGSYFEEKDAEKCAEYILDLISKNIQVEVEGLLHRAKMNSAMLSREAPEEVKENAIQMIKIIEGLKK